MLHWVINACRKVDCHSTCPAPGFGCCLLAHKSLVKRLWSISESNYCRFIQILGTLKDSAAPPSSISCSQVTLSIAGSSRSKSTHHQRFVEFMVQVSLLSSLYQILRDRNTKERINGPKEASGFSIPLLKIYLRELKIETQTTACA